MKLVGAVVEMDFGSGLEIIPQNRLGEPVSFKETIVGYGAAEWSFTLLDVDSPLSSTLLMYQRRVRLTLYWGKPGSIQNSLLVDGYTREPKWDYRSRSAEITCQDSSVKFATQRLTLSTAVNPAGTPRETVLSGALATYGIPASIDCPGDVRKSINEAGDKSVLDWVSLFVAPAGRRAYWRNGTLLVVSTDIGAPVADITAHDVRTMTIAPAPTNATNSILFTSLLIDDSVLADGSVTVTEDEDGIYTPKVAVQRQNADGTIDPVSVTSVPASPISRKVTTKTALGGVIVETLIEEWRWMSPFAPRAQQLAASYSELQPVIVPSGIVCYDFGDGDKWHITDQETFRIWRRTLVEEFYSGGLHTGRRTTIRLNWIHAYIPFGRAVGNSVTYYDTVDAVVKDRAATGPDGLLWIWYGATGAPGAVVTPEALSAPVYLWEFDQGSDRVTSAVETTTSAEAGYEHPSLIIDDAFVRNAVGDIAAVRRTLTFDRGIYGGIAGDAARDDSRRWRAGFPPFTSGDLFQIVGNLSQPRHEIHQSGEVEGEFVIGYLPTTQSSRTGHVISVSGTGTPDVTNRPLGYESEMSLPAPGSSFLVDTAVAIEDRVGPFTIPVTETVSAASFVTANGPYQVPARNDYCETSSEEQVVARDLLRQSLSNLPTIEIDPRGDIRAGDTVRLVCQSNTLALVRDNEIRINLRTLGEAVQALTCMVWPSELD